MRIRRILSNALIVTGSCLAALLACEVLLRFLYPDAAHPRNAYNRLDYRFDSDYLVALNPNIESTFRRSRENGGDLIRWRTNSLGLRGNELRSNPDIRIVVYGDSNIQASFSLLENTFSQKLEKELHSLAKKDVEVINAGVVGFGPDQSLLRMRKEIDLYRPDIVVLHVFADNDFGDVVRNRLFDLDPSGELVATPYEKIVDDVLASSDEQPMASSWLIVRAARMAWNKLSADAKNNDSDSLETAEQVLQYLLAVNAEQFAVYESSAPRKYSHFADLYDADVAVYPDSARARKKIQLMDAVLREARDTASARAVRLFVVIQPSQIDLTTNSTLNYSELRSYPGYRQDNLSGAVEKILAKHHIDGVNLFHAFSRQTPDALFFKGSDDHWNDEGQALAATVAARNLYARLLADEDAVPSGPPVN